MFSPKKLQLSLLVCTVMILAGCAEWTIHDTESLLFPRFRHSEVVGFVAGLGTTFAALQTRCYQDRTNQLHQAPCREHPGL